MNKYIILLRGINVSGKNKIKMSDFRDLLENEFQNVQTYIQSGNIILDSSQKELPVKSKINDIIQVNYGYNVPVLVISAQNWKELFFGNKLIEKYPDKLNTHHVSIFESNISNENLNEITARTGNGEVVQCFGKYLFLYCPNGYGRSKISNNHLERITKMSCTTRNWKTVLKLEELMNE